jgi:hypothetical protein
MISILGLGYFQNNRGQCIHDGMIVKSSGNKDALFRLENIDQQDNSLDYWYRYDSNSEWSGPSKYNLDAGKEIFYYD